MSVSLLLEAGQTKVGCPAENRKYFLLNRTQIVRNWPFDSITKSGCCDERKKTRPDTLDQSIESFLDRGEDSCEAIQSEGSSGRLL